MTESNFTEKIIEKLNTEGVVILPHMDVFKSIKPLNDSGIKVSTTILDPWYNKGFGGTVPNEDYDAFIHNLLNKCAVFSNVLYL